MPSVVSRAQWGANPASVGKYGRMPGPVLKVWVHHSVTTATAPPRDAAKTLESIGMSRFGVFSYSFAIHQDGTILEGAGWNFVGAHTSLQNSTSYGICFIGNYELDALTPAQIDSFRWLIQRGKALGKIAATAEIDAHRNAPNAATACPGTNVMSKMDALRKPFRTKKEWVVLGEKRKRSVVTGLVKARALKAVWVARGFKVTITEK